MQHDMRELSVTPGEWVDGVFIGTDESEHTYGCFICGMGEDESKIKECPGEGSANDDID